MDDAQARRWLTSLFDGAAALTDEQIREGARLCASTMDAQRRLAEAKQGEDTRAAQERLEQCRPLWDDFIQVHGLTAKRSA
jgi:hypothetical protein